MISILSHTSKSFGDAIYAKLGKGHIHATLIYEEWFRRGTIHGNDPAFNNAKLLFQEIVGLIDTSMPVISHEKNDGKTGKFLLKTHDNLEVEAVLIPMQSGGTLCVSSQVGCRMGCTFCETGRMGLLRNLTISEIVSQVFVARHQLNFEFKNVVFMGMGEPFDNYEAVMAAIKILNDPKGFGFGRRQVTVSTSGCVDGIEKLIQEGDHAPNLAVSINAPTDILRSKIMPVNRKHDMAELHRAMSQYCQKTNREILVAYVLLKELNDSTEHADQLAHYLQGLNVKINLIPYNPQSCDRFAAPDPLTLDAFAKHLRDKGFYTLLRTTKGKDIMAACGQLGNVKLRQQIRDLRG